MYRAYDCVLLWTNYVGGVVVCKWQPKSAIFNLCDGVVVNLNIMNDYSRLWWLSLVM